MRIALLAILLLCAPPAYAANTTAPGQYPELVVNIGNGEYGAIGNGVRSVTSGTTDTVQPSDGLIQLQTGASVTETIPGGNVNGQMLSITDGSGTAAASPITLTTTGGGTIGGRTSLILSDNFFNISLKWDNLANWIITSYYSGSKSLAPTAYALVKTGIIVGTGTGTLVRLR